MICTVNNIIKLALNFFLIKIYMYFCWAEEDTDTGSLMKMQYEAYIQTLPNSVNKDLIDKVGLDLRI